MKYHARIGGREHALDVRVVRDGLEVELDGAVHRVDLSTVAAGEKYSILIDGRSYAVSVDGDGRRLSLMVSGRSYHAEIEDERERAVAGIGGPSGPSGGVVESVMPGIVRRIEVAPGKTVAPGDRLLILEAMKMENEIRAEIAGIVTEVHVTADQAVDGGQKLVTIRPG